jgi:cytochrome c-type biogenesis protein
MDLPGLLSHALSTGNVAALPLALAGGLVAGLNPCCLALYRAAAAACCGVQHPRMAQPTTGNAIAFVMGVAFAVAALGALAAYLGRVAVMASPVRYAIALLPILMGVYYFGWVRLPDVALKGFHPRLGERLGLGCCSHSLSARAAPRCLLPSSPSPPTRKA